MNTEKKLIFSLLFILTFIVCRGQVAFEQSSLPIVIIQTGGNQIVDEPKVEAEMKIINNASGVNKVSDPVNGYNGKIGIEFRGSSSQFFFDKKNFGIELWTELGEDTSAVILDMPEEEDWVLHGPYSDKTLLRNALTFNLWSKMGRYGSRTRFCEVVLNDDYIGVYLMMEKIKRDKGRVNISKLTEEENAGDDLTGGYIVKVDKFDGTNSQVGWTSPFSPPGKTREDQVIFFQFDYPKGRNITSEQANYIESYVTEFEEALSGPDFKNSVSGFRSFIDVNSFIDFALINEVNKNVDGYRLSTFLHKDKNSEGGLLSIGPIWDFNLAFGNADYCEGGSTHGWAWDFNERCDEDFWLIPFWWNRFLQDEAFVLDLKNRWTELRNGPFKTTSVLNYIDSMATVLEQPVERNFERWPILDTYVWPNQFVGDGEYTTEVTYLKDWVTGRLEWLDDNISIIENTPITVGINDLKDHFKIYPNPSSFEVYIESDKLIEQIDIFDSKGMRVQQYSVLPTNEYKIDVSDLSKGAYLIRSISSTGESVKRIFVKE